MQERGHEHLRLIGTLLNEDVQLDTRYLRLRKLLDVATSDLLAQEIKEENIEIDLGRLFDKLNFLIRKYNVYPRSNGIHKARISCNDVIHGAKEPSINEFRSDATEVKFFISYFFGISSSVEPVSEGSITTVTSKLTMPISGPFVRGPWKCIVTSIDPETFSFKGIVSNEEEDEGNELEFRLEEFTRSNGKTQTNLLFKDTLKYVRIGDELNLTMIYPRDGYYAPAYIIYYPDYLVNVSDIANSILDLKWDLDNWHVHYLYNLLNPIEPNVYLFRGNLVNDILDELILLNGQEFNYKEWLKGSFKDYPLEYTVFFNDQGSGSVDFAQSLKDHRDGLLSGVEGLKRDNIDLSRSEIEPTFLQPVYGLQGRLDLMHFNNDVDPPKLHIVELKTSKVYGEGVKAENAAQLALYDLLTRNVSSDLTNRTRVPGLRAILYSSSIDKPIRKHQPFFEESQFLMNVRNVFVAHERNIANDVKASNIVSMLVDYLELPIRGLNKFDSPRYQNWKTTLMGSSEIFKIYFGEYLKFGLKEKWYAKMGNPFSNRLTGGYRNTWIQPLSEKIEDCSIVANLQTKSVIKDENGHLTGIVLKRSAKDKGNDSFKIGDIVYLIEQGKSRFNLHNSLISATIEQLRLGEIELQIGQMQLGMEKRLSRPEQIWMIEHRLFESSYNLMINNLVTLSKCEISKQNLLLGLQKPVMEITEEIHEPGLTVQQALAVNKAVNAKDYFLIHGVPGSGKTSRVIKAIVKHESKRPGGILLLSYTNKAADKLTEVLVELNEEGENIPFFRMGREKAIAEELHGTLLEKKASELNDRAGVRGMIDSTKVVISTLAGLKPTDIIFLAKNFRCAIIDEASQILEPTIVGVLTKVNKFILVGDHKQLPAISLHTTEQGKLSDDHPLRTELGIKSLRNSYFERIYDRSIEKEWGVTEELTGQGRMHQDIMRFPSHVFYGDKLHLLSDRIQTQPLELTLPNAPSALEAALSKEHILFINSAREKVSTEKTNQAESKLVGDIIEALIKMNGSDFMPNKKIGVITPFRNQRGMIRQELLERNIPFAQDLLIDTVESFQGSEKDHIIISFSVNDPSQMKLITEWNEDRTVDRKLNVALTRAKKQLIMLGNEAVLSHEKVYGNLIEYCRSNEQYLNPQLEPSNLENGVSALTPEFYETFDNLVMKPIKEDPRTEWANIILGKDAYFNRTQIIEGGRANFTEALFDGDGRMWSAEDRVLAYCYWNMRLHYFSSRYIFQKFIGELKINHFFDIGCGPGTSSVAISEIQNGMPSFHLVDISKPMLDKAKQFLGLNGIESRTNTELKDVDTESISGVVLINFSFLFANVDDEFRKDLESLTSKLINKAQQVMIINQNSANSDLNLVWDSYKQFLINNGFSSLGSSMNLNISYSNQLNGEPNKLTTLSYEVLSN